MASMTSLAQGRKHVLYCGPLFVLQVNRVWLSSSSFKLDTRLCGLCAPLPRKNANSTACDMALFSYELQVKLAMSMEGTATGEHGIGAGKRVRHWLAAYAVFFISSIVPRPSTLVWIHFISKRYPQPQLGSV